MEKNSNILRGQPWLMLLALFVWLLPQQAAAELTYEDDTVNMMISSGSIDNIKPELVINALFEASQKSYTSQDLLIKRIDQYTLIEDKLISLDLIGSNIDG